MQVKPISAPPVPGSSERLVFDGSSAAVCASKPARLNNAGVCLFCMTRWCDSARCVALHAESYWIVCEACDGFNAECDMCVGGVVEACAEARASQATRVLPMVWQELDSVVVVVGGGR